MTKRNFKKLKTMAKQKQDEPCIRLLTIDNVMKNGQIIQDEMDRKVKVKGKWITLNGCYDISLGEISTEKVLLKKVLHLTEKNWVTSDMVNHFIRKVFKAKGWV